MPFTGSHPAAVLPFVGTRLPASALVIGSMAPDLPFFVHAYGVPTHQPWAICTVDVAIGFAAWALWHGLLAAPAIDAAPLGLRARLPAGASDGLGPRLRSVSEVGLLAAAFALGSLTHVALDQFTHGGMWGARHIAALREAWGPLPGYSWLQWAGSVLGAGILVWWVARWWRRTAPRPGVTARRYAWGPWVVAGAGAVGLVAGLAAAARWHDLTWSVFLGATYGGGLAAAAWVVLACAWHAARWRRGRTAAA